VSALFVSYSGLFGGSERVLIDLTTGLGGDPVILCPEGPLADRARAAGIRTFTVPQRRLELRATARDRVATPLRIAALAREVRDLTRSLRPDVVFGWGTRAAMACAAALSGLEPRPRFVFQNNDILRGPVISQAVRAAARRADLIVAPSAVVARDLDTDGTLAARTVVVPPGVDLAHFEPGDADRPREALLLGAIVGWKRPRLALEAVALAARELPDLKLRVAGPVIDTEGERIMELMRRRAELPDLAGRVEFAGPLADPAPALSRAGCLLHCSDCEPFGVVLVEALAAGTPVVAPASCGPAEIVAPACGRHYLPGDAAGAARALVEVLGDADRARALGQGGRERAVELYSLAGSRRRYAEVIDSLLDDRPARDSGGDLPGAELALVTVIHNSADDLRALLDSVDRHLPGAQMIVVDSGSSDGGPAIARAWRGGAATTIDMGGNVGFGRASNAGVEAAERPVTVLVNPDVELLDASLAELGREAMRDDAAERLLAPVVIGADGRRQDSAQLEPGTIPLGLSALVPPALLPPPLARQVDPWRADRPRAVGWAVGACVAGRTETLRRLGPFDPGEFLYAEDLDLGLRAADAGIETWFWPGARVLHHGAHSTRKAFGGEAFDLLARRRRQVVRKWRGARRQEADDALQLLTFANRVAIKAALRRPVRRERRQLEALRRARREDAQRQRRR
jgi:N-acetylglucosaminyl-diphospho-decaprenol L-rhamnosyltransferase